MITKEDRQEVIRKLIKDYKLCLENSKTDLEKEYYKDVINKLNKILIK